MEVFNTEQDTAPGVNFIREGIRIGLINAAIALLLMFGSYYAGLEAFVTTQFIGGFLPYMIIILIIYGIQLRKRNGGYMAFKEGLQYAFVSYVVVTILVAIGTYILYNVIDKELTQKSFDMGMERTRSFMERMGTPTEEVDKQIEKMGKPTTGSKNFILGIGQDLIWHFVKSLLIALVIKREKPIL